MSIANPRYAAFIIAGGGVNRPNWQYVNFIAKMKSLYIGSVFAPIFNHSEFTAFIDANAHKFEFE